MELLKLSQVVPSSGLGTFSNAEVSAIENFLALPTNVRNKAIEVHKSNRGAPKAPANVLGYTRDLTNNSFPLDKNMIVNINADAHIKSVEHINNALIGGRSETPSF